MNKINVVLYFFIILNAILFSFDIGLPTTKYLFIIGIMYLFLLDPVLRKKIKKKGWFISQMETREMKAVNGGVIPVAAWYIGAFLVGVAGAIVYAGWKSVE